ADRKIAADRPGDRRRGVPEEHPSERAVRDRGRPAPPAVPRHGRLEDVDRRHDAALGPGTPVRRGSAMCELMGLSFDQPVSADFSLRAFACRDAENPDGWGLAWYPDQSLALVKEALT